MQALRDAGIVLVVILLAVSVRFTPLDETGQETRLASLTPQVEAAPLPLQFDPEQIGLGESATPANAAVDPTPVQFFSVPQLVLNDGEEILRDVDIDVAEHCTELLIHLRKAAEETRNDVFVLQAEEVVKVLPCSA